MNPISISEPELTHQTLTDKMFWFVGPKWESPAPGIRLLASSEKSEGSKQDFEVDIPEVEILPTSRCYHPDMYAAEDTIARELARLAAAPPRIVRAKINKWITENEKEEGEFIEFQPLC